MLIVCSASISSELEFWSGIAVRPGDATRYTGLLFLLGLRRGLDKTCPGGKKVTGLTSPYPGHLIPAFLHAVHDGSAESHTHRRRRHSQHVTFGPRAGATDDELISVAAETDVNLNREAERTCRRTRWSRPFQL